MTAGKQYLLKRGHTWYFRLTVPEVLRKHEGKKEIVESLKTRDLTVAQRLRWERLEHHQKRFDAMRGAPIASPSDLGRDSYNEMVSFAETLPVEELETLQDRTLERAEEAAIGFDEESGHPIGVPAAIEAQFLAVKDTIENLKTGRKNERPEYGLPISEASRRFLTREVALYMNEQTASQHQRTLNCLAEFVGDKSISSLSRRDVAQFIGTLACMSNSWGRAVADKGQSFASLVEKYSNKGTPLSDGTLNRHLGAIKGMWRWAYDNGHTENGDPTDGLHRKKNRRREKSAQYKGFTPDEILQLLALPKARSIEVVEIALIGLYSGMRLEEICMLDWSDIVEQNGVVAFDITAAKSHAGIRQVPVHSKLEWLLQRRTKNGPIWPSLRATKNPSQTLSKRFATFRVSHGFEGKGKVFHSLRKTFVSQLFAARVQEAEIAQIVGHENRNITSSVYNPGGFALSQSKENVERFQIKGLDPEEILHLHS